MKKVDREKLITDLANLGKTPSELILERARKKIKSIAPQWEHGLPLDPDNNYIPVYDLRFIIREILDWIDDHHTGKDRHVK